MRYLIWNLFGPQVWPFWLFLIGTLCLFVGRPKLAKPSLALGTATFLLFGLTPLPGLLMNMLEDDYPRLTANDVEPDHILVLGGGEAIAATARAGTLEINAHGDRILRGVDLADAHPDAQLWIAGYGRYADFPNEVAATAAFWQRAGIAAGRIGRIEDTGDTCENLHGFAAEETEGTTLLVTSAFHMRRSMACAAAAGIEVTPYTVDYRTGTDVRWPLNPIANLETLGLATHEYLGLVYYRLTGRI
ncbi:MAG: YdcF family protein [Pacificimonas sp.]|jgi:uncharacterized SAM-binding protein YcdF (DUF218 family)|nr:YdcF family protein [Pacificimonas sp.]